MIRFALKEDIPALKYLWRKCFVGDDDYVELFFQHRFLPEETLVYCENDTPVSAVYLLPAAINAAGKPETLFYVYAAATLPEYRSRGIMGKLLFAAEEYAACRNMRYLALVPSEKQLFDYYARFGYRPVFYRNLVTAAFDDIVETNTTDFFDADADLLQEVMNGYLSDREFSVFWGKNAAEYAIRDIEYYGGRMLGFDYGGRRGYATVVPSDSELFVKELLCADGDALHALGGLKRLYPREKYRISLKSDLDIGIGKSENAPFGMLKALGNAPLPRETDCPYINLTLD